MKNHVFSEHRFFQNKTWFFENRVPVVARRSLLRVRVDFGGAQNHRKWEKTVFVRVKKRRSKNRPKKAIVTIPGWNCDIAVPRNSVGPAERICIFEKTTAPTKTGTVSKWRVKKVGFLEVQSRLWEAKNHEKWRLFRNMKNMKKTWQGQRFQHIGGSRIDKKTIKNIIEKSENRGVKKEAKKELCHSLTGGWRTVDARTAQAMSGR